MSAPRVLSPVDADYPALLAATSLPPTLWVRGTLLDADHVPAVRERSGLIAVGDPPSDLVDGQKPEPDRDLEAEIRPPPRQKTASGCDDGLGHNG